MDACPVRVEQVLKATVDRYGPRYHAQVTVPNAKSRWTWHYTSAPRIILAPKSSTKTMTRSAGRRFNCSSRVKRRALDGQPPHSPDEIGTWFEQTARAWNEQPTPFVWNGKRRQ